MIKVSPSQIGMLLECPRCLWLFYNENIKRPEGIFPSLPGGMDGIFKVYFDKYRRVGKLPPEIKGKVEGRLFTDLKKLDVWRSNYRGLTANFPRYNLVLKGAIDDLIITPAGKYAPLDFKTRGYALKADTHTHYRTQLNLYSLLFETNDLPVADFGYLVFFWPTEFSASKALFNIDVVKLAVDPKEGKKTLQLVAKIISGPKPPAHSQCQYCLYRGYTGD